MHPKKFIRCQQKIGHLKSKIEANVCQGSRRIFWKLFIHFVIDGAEPETVIFYANTNHQDRKLYRIFTLFITISMKNENYNVGNVRNVFLFSPNIMH